jgi:8-oxo-dGTP pyrophosphatase MutT (NUDIX family)
MPETTLCGLEDSGGLEILMICRRDSLRFVEFIRGKYSIKDTTYIKQLLENMVVAERDLLLKLSFPELWNHVWGTSNPRNYRNDFEQSQEKFNELKSSDQLARLIAETEPLWTSPEWGFPKGRRNPNESDIDCAIRECIEETGLTRQQLGVFDSVEPLTETFYGDNKVYYSHKYYPAIVATNTEVSMNTMNPHMSREIGDIRWLSIEEAMAKIRPDATEKREILLRAANILRNFCPFRNEKYFLRLRDKKQSDN